MGALFTGMTGPLVAVSLCTFVLIVYFALSKHSSPPVKGTAVIALIVIAVAVLVSLFLIWSEPAGVLSNKPPPDPLEKPVPVKIVKATPILAVAILFLLFIASIVYISLRDKKKEREQQAEEEKEEEED
ncbi:MAG: hypothetical protein LBD74_03265 [Spirochaetaceae bacterium]|jgi:amino acid transporter|nr:hypothetical protein [Spirochaetaceae bacterium]